MVEATLNQLFQETDHTQTVIATRTKAGWCLREGLMHILSVRRNDTGKDKMADVVRDHPLPSIYSSLQCCHRPNKDDGDVEGDGDGDPKDCFQSLCKTIAGQQLAGAAARTVWNRLLLTTDHNPTPATILSLVNASNGIDSYDESLLRTALQTPSGLSLAKARAILDTAFHFRSGRISDEFLASSPEASVRDRLLAIRGIGPWTCDIFLMFFLERSDVLPFGDLGVRKGMAKFFGLKGSGKNAVLCGKKDFEVMERVMEPYRPYRSLAAYYMWKVADDKNFECDGGSGSGSGGRSRGEEKKSF